MPAQASLEGFDAPSAPTDRLFFALMPDAAAAERAEQLALALSQQHGLKPRPGARDRFHVTLFHVGDFAGLPSQEVDQAGHVAEALRAQPFEVRFDRVASFSGSPRKLPYVLLGDESPAMMAFQADMRVHMHKAGLTQGANQRQFTPHLTLLYGQQQLAEQHIDPIAWTASEFVLIHSVLGRGQYITLGRWPLQPA